MFVNQVLHFLWKLQFWVNCGTFDCICNLVEPVLKEQDTQFRKAVRIEKCVTAAVWRFGTGDCYRSIGTTFRIGKSTAHEFKLDFVDALLQHYDTFIKFLGTEDETRRYQ